MPVTPSLQVHYNHSIDTRSYLTNVVNGSTIYGCVTVEYFYHTVQKMEWTW